MRKNCAHRLCGVGTTPDARHHCRTAEAWPYTGKQQGFSKGCLSCCTRRGPAAASHHTYCAKEVASHDSHVAPLIVWHDRNFGSLIVLISRLDHFVFCWQVGPQLKAMQVAICDFGHFTVHDAAASCHPLHAPVHDRALRPYRVMEECFIVSSIFVVAVWCAQTCTSCEVPKPSRPCRRATQHHQESASSKNTRLTAPCFPLSPCVP